MVVRLIRRFRGRTARGPNDRLMARRPAFVVWPTNLGVTLGEWEDRGRSEVRDRPIYRIRGVRRERGLPWGRPRL